MYRYMTDLGSSVLHSKVRENLNKIKIENSILDQMSNIYMVSSSNNSCISVLAVLVELACGMPLRYMDRSTDGLGGLTTVLDYTNPDAICIKTASTYSGNVKIISGTAEKHIREQGYILPGQEESNQIIAIGKERKEIIYFHYYYDDVPKKFIQVKLLLTAYRAYAKNKTEVTETLFNELAKILLEEDLGYTEKQNKITQSIIEAVKKIPELKIDMSEEFAKVFQYKNTSRKRAIELEINDAQLDINNYNQRLITAIQKLEKLKQDLFYYEYSEYDPTEAKNLYKDLERYSTISQLSVIDEQTITFIVTQKLTTNSKPTLERMIECAMCTDSTKELLTKALINEEIELHTKALIRLNPGALDYGCTGTTTKGPQVINNPHLAKYNCFGGHKSTIAQALQENNWAAAIEQMIEAEAGLNAYDSVVFRALVQYLESNREVKTFKKNTGEWFSINDYVEGK